MPLATPVPPGPAGLPLPVARLRRRSLNAASASLAHNTAYWAWEVSVRLAVAAHGRFAPDDVRHATLGHWVGAMVTDDAAITEPALLDALQLFREIGLGTVGSPRSTSARELLDALVAYRNRVIGHGSARDERFYADAARRLLDGLDAAWERGLFFEANARLAYSESVAVDRDGTKRVRWLDLSSEMPLVQDPLGTPVAADVLPRRLYLQSAGRLRPLHPWVVYEERRERVWCFQAFGRRPEYIDYGSGDLLRGADLERELPGLAAEISSLFSNVRTAPGPREEEPADGADRFGGFRLLGKLGEGGMGAVYLARQESLGRLVALKMLGAHARHDAVAVARFQREIEALARCEHPNVVKILASGEHAGVLYYAMEYVAGADLGRVGSALSKTGELHRAVSSAWQEVRAEGRELFDGLPELAERAAEVPESGDRFRDCARLFRDAVLAVQHLHDHGIVHRDISPSNVRISVPNERAVVMDLGLAMLEGASISLTRDRAHVLGTLRYMSPEQLQRNLLSVDRRTDVYSLGAVLYELLAGKPFHDGDSEARLIEQILRREPIPLEKVEPRVPRDLATIVRKATDKDPALRYESAQAMADDLGAFLEHRPISAVPPTPIYVLKKWLQRNRALAASYAVILVVLCVAGLFGTREVQARMRAEEDRDRASIGASADMCAQLERESAELWPAIPENVLRMRIWLRSARELVAQRAEIQQKLEALHVSDRDRPAEGLDHQRSRSMAELVRGLNALADEHGAPGSIADVEARLKRALSDTGPDRARLAEAWALARAAIRDPARCPRYAGLELAEQPGLVPLGEDPRTRLWEFAVHGTGSLPTRSATGELERQPDFAVVLVLLPGGSFTMGADSSLDQLPDEEAGRIRAANQAWPHSVELAPFFAGKYELTQAQWRSLSGLEPSTYGSERNGKPDMPVESVSWDECRTVLPRAKLGLPTEAQWEYAARAGTDTAWWVGNDVRGLESAGNTADQALYRAHADRTFPFELSIDDGATIPSAVGRWEANAFGLHDTIGNVAEWCRDAKASYESEVRPGDGERMGGDQTQRVLRGGGWDGGPAYARSCQRSFNPPSARLNFVGVRPARAIDP